MLPGKESPNPSDGATKEKNPSSKNLTPQKTSKFKNKYRRQPSEVTEMQIRTTTIPTKETKHVEIRRDSEGNKRVNQYLVLKNIGQGAYGKVKLVMNSDDKSLFAMKIMRKSTLMRKRVGLKKGTAWEDVQREISIMKTLDNFFIIKLFELIDDPNEDRLFLIEEYAEGGATMKGEMETIPISEEKARKYFHDTVCGLEYLHSQKVVHRDIKPENLLVNAAGTVKISDFGVSISLDTPDADIQLKKTVGSPVFLPPELCAAETKRINGTAVDIWCLGVTLYFWIFGKPPFIGETEMQMYENIRTKKLVFPHKIDKDLADILKRLLAKEPQNRISIREIKKHPWSKWDRFEKR